MLTYTVRDSGTGASLYTSRWTTRGKSLQSPSVRRDVASVRHALALGLRILRAQRREATRARCPYSPDHYAMRTVHAYSYCPACFAPFA